MKILITGATGTIGSNAVKYFTEKGYKVRAQVRPNSQRIHKIRKFNPEIVSVDLKDKEGLYELVKDVDYILHLGGQVKKNNPSNHDYWEINTTSTLSLLEGVRINNVRLKRFVYASSCAIYKFRGWNNKSISKCDKDSNPKGMYKVSKLAAEMIVNSYNIKYKIPTVVLELPDTFCGREVLGERNKQISPFIKDKIDVLSRLPRSKERDKVIDELKNNLKEGKKLLIPVGEGNVPWKQHLGDIRDVLNACEKALTEPKAVGESLIVMSNAIDYNEGVPKLAEVSGLKYAKVYVPFGDNYWFGMKDTYEKLGYTPKFNSSQILIDAWKHYKGEDIGIVDGDEYPFIQRE